MGIKKYILLVIFFVAASSLIFPPPKSQKFTGGHIYINNLSSLKFTQFPQRLEALRQEYDYYLYKVINRIEGKKASIFQYNLKELSRDLFLKPISFTLHYDKTLHSEGYKLFVKSSGIDIYFATYTGYVYALYTLSQLIEQGPALKKKIPCVEIYDYPLLSYRGIMIDSVRHFLSVYAIGRLIESMPLSKLNILHWHFSDDEAFTVRLDSHPELADDSVYSAGESYSIEDVKQIIAFARKNAVQIVPEVDTPAHVRSWGQSVKWNGLTILCGGGEGYNQQFDLSKQEVYDMVAYTLQYVAALFVDSPYLHLGGDEVSGACWDRQPAIKQFMKQRNITSYGQLQMYWRLKTKQALPPGRKVMFWRNDGTDVTSSPNDILHFWGAQADLVKIAANSTSQIVYSPSDILYLNKGQGNIWLNTTAGDYSVWRSIYENLVFFPKGMDRSRILGAEVCLWGEVSNENTLENNLWMRASAFAARAWSEPKLPLGNIVPGLLALYKTLKAMNVHPSPLTVNVCEIYPDRCFGSPSND